MARMKSLFFILFLSSSMNLANSQEDAAKPIVKTITGKLSGVVDETTTGNSFYKFLGVPYAEPPVEKLRFKDPLAKKAWSGTINATETPEKCVQISAFPGFPVSLAGSEDCLYLNIYTPSLPHPDHQGTKSLMPVMFWIHGGGFTTGDGQINPEFILDEGVLVVSVNYRLGPFGFLALEGNPQLAGNLGLKDQQEALIWVHRNIKYFGGDPSKVTLFGESAGAVSVHAHVLSPRIKNIFQGAILQSGTVLLRYDSYFMEKEVQNSSARFLKKINCDVHDVVKCLQTKDVDTLMQFSTNNTEEEISSSYWAVQDSCAYSPVLPYNPLQQLSLGSFKKVPIIVGTTKDDGGIVIILDPRVKAGFEGNSSNTLGSTLGLATQNVTKEEIKIVDIMKRFYLSEGSYDDNEKNLIEMETDSWFASPAAEVTKLHMKLAPVFPYILNERCTIFSFSFVYGGGFKDYGVSHADDLNCLFQPFPTFGNLTESGEKNSKAMVTSWTNFAKFGNPSPYLTSEPQWPKGEVMFFEEESGLKKNETQLENLMARMLLWDKIYWVDMEDKSRASTFPMCMAGKHHHHHHVYHIHK